MGQICLISFFEIAVLRIKKMTKKKKIEKNDLSPNIKGKQTP